MGEGVRLRGIVAGSGGTRWKVERVEVARVVAWFGVVWRGDGEVSEGRSALLFVASFLVRKTSCSAPGTASKHCATSLHATSPSPRIYHRRQSKLSRNGRVILRRQKRGHKARMGSAKREVEAMMGDLVEGMRSLAFP